MKVPDAHSCGIDSGGSPVVFKLAGVRPDFGEAERRFYTQSIQSPDRLCATHYLSESASAYCSPAARDFRERPRIGRDGFGDGLAVDELPFAAAGDEPGFAQNLEMVRDGCGGNAAHRNDLAAIHLLGPRDGLKNPEAGLVGQGFRYFLNLRAIHVGNLSVAKSLPLPPGRTLSFRKVREKTCNQSLR
jgi:hypothetical protein